MRSPFRLVLSLGLAVGASAVFVACKKGQGKEAPAAGSSQATPVEPPPDKPHDDHAMGSADDGSAHAHDDHGDKGEPTTTPATLAEAAAAIDTESRELAGIVKDGDLSKAHEVADHLSKLGAALPDLATKAGRSPDDVKALTIAGKKLELFFDDMDAAGDGGNRDTAKAVFARYAEPLATIKAKAVQ